MEWLSEEIDDETAYYRYEFNNFNPLTPDLFRFKKVRDTPKGVVVIPMWVVGSSLYESNRKRYERFVRNSAINKYCYKTSEEAFFGFRKRQEKRKEILELQLKRITEFLEG